MYVTYKSWQDACLMMESERSRHACYLQWYPFSTLNKYDWEQLKSKKYYDTFIEDASFILCDSHRFKTAGFIQKEGYSFRESYLVSPQIFLYLLAYAIQYSEVYIPQRQGDWCFYAGNLSERQLFYKKSWQSFCKKLKFNAGRFKYCIRTDLSNFYNDINVDNLIAKMQQYSNEGYSATDGIFLKNLLLYCGNGKYPVIQNHPSLSFFATEVYLAEVDTELCKRLDAISSIQSYELVRFVDDMYIFFDIDDKLDVGAVKHLIISRYADLLRNESLALNQKN